MSVWLQSIQAARTVGSEADGEDAAPGGGQSSSWSPNSEVSLCCWLWAPGPPSSQTWQRPAGQWDSVSQVWKDSPT